MSRVRLAVPLLAGVLVAAIVLFWPEPGPPVRAGESVAEASGAANAATPPLYDLDRDEALGGHTLSRHVGRSDEELRSRLSAEPGISAASTFTNRETAERVVASTLARAAARIERWLARGGGNLALDYRGAPGEIVGRTLGRGDHRPRPASDARVVLGHRRDGSFIVVTAYPLEPR